MKKLIAIMLAALMLCAMTACTENENTPSTPSQVEGYIFTYQGLDLMPGADFDAAALSIVESFEKAGVPVERVVLSGGIPSKNPLIVQIYTEVLNREIKVCASDQACALGAAVLGTAAAPESVTGYKDANEIAAKFARLQDKTYIPNPAQVAVYDKLYAEYNTLMDYFGRGANDVMKRLNKIREENK